MRVRFSLGYGQVVFVLIALLSVPLVSGCHRSTEEIPVMPPPTFPLARDYIGYGVVNVSFTNLLSEPSSGGISRGYLRRGTVVRIIERRTVANRVSGESWVLVEGNYSPSSGSQGPALSRGWLQETMLEIYDNESRADTASKAMNP